MRHIVERESLAWHVNESVQVSFLAAGFSYASGRCTGTCHGEQHSGERW